ncbi:MAG TPA: aminodeoxychorismate/anthranilate synthase component I, partial [Pirellulaceae bacterium]|nr:aminodeoxychorismate/anthranilate synthase component I [Pirellulaceae bacterium]
MLVEELSPSPDPELVWLSAAETGRGALFLDSAQRDSQLGRYSFVACEPFDYLELSADAPAPLDELQRRLAPWHATTVRELPPFQGG